MFFISGEQKSNFNETQTYCQYGGGTPFHSPKVTLWESLLLVPMS